MGWHPDPTPLLQIQQVVTVFNFIYSHKSFQWWCYCVWCFQDVARSAIVWQFTAVFFPIDQREDQAADVPQLFQPNTARFHGVCMVVNPPTSLCVFFRSSFAKVLMISASHSFAVPKFNNFFLGNDPVAVILLYRINTYNLGKNASEQTFIESLYGSVEMCPTHSVCVPLPCVG